MTALTGPNYPLIRIVGILFGLPVLAFSLFTLVRTTQAEHWPWAQGRVTRSLQVGMGEEQELRFQVLYNVNGVTYRCGRIEFATLPLPRDQYRYYEGVEARVYYRPSDPTECVLEPGISGVLVAELLTGLALCLWALYAHSRLRVVGS